MPKTYKSTDEQNWKHHIRCRCRHPDNFARTARAFPECEVDNEEHQEQAKCHGRLHTAQVIQASGLFAFQHGEAEKCRNWTFSNINYQFTCKIPVKACATLAHPVLFQRRHSATPGTILCSRCCCNASRALPSAERTLMKDIQSW